MEVYRLRQGQGRLEIHHEISPLENPALAHEGGICERFASIVISIYMDGRFRIRKCWRGKSLYDFRTTRTSR